MVSQFINQKETFIIHTFVEKMNGRLQFIYSIVCLLEVPFFVYSFFFTISVIKFSPTNIKSNRTSELATISPIAATTSIQNAGGLNEKKIKKRNYIALVIEHADKAKKKNGEKNS